VSSTALLARVEGRARSAPFVPWLGLVAVILGAALVIGAVAVRSPLLGVVCAAIPAAVGAILWLRGRTTWVVFIFTLGGLAVLGYGFANIPAVPSAPVPLVDVLLVGAFLGLVFTGGRLPVPRLPFMVAALLFGFSTIRLVVDYSTWGSLALRDYTTYVELSALFVGYWLMERIGLERWVRALTWISVTVVIYGLMQFSGIFSTFNVLVGIQRPVTLLGHVTGVASVSAFFFFALLRPFGSRSLVWAALATAPLFLFQSRGLYLALPLVIVLLALLRSRTRGLRRISAATAFAVIVAVIVLVIQPSGRFGTASPALVREQLMTLVGGTGVGDGSLNARTQWFAETTSRVSATTGALIYGLGLGPDLAGGFSADSVLLVRKPHDDFLEVFARLGLVGLGLFVLLLGSALKGIVMGSRRSATSRERFFQQWVLANSAIYLFIAATQPLLAYPYGTIPLFSLLGAGLAVGAGRHRGAEVNAPTIRTAA
jgi:O-antigen ligase